MVTAPAASHMPAVTMTMADLDDGAVGIGRQYRWRCMGHRRGRQGWSKRKGAGG
jgi:hypothetical protein